ncbi:MAG: sensor histidine kinase [Pseudomonadales bacterium]
MESVQALVPAEQLRQTMINAEPAAQAELRAAFELFNELADTLTDSYDTLQAEVQQLRCELQAAEAQKDVAQTQTRRATRRLEDLLQNLPGGVVLLDQRGFVQDCNPAAVDLLGEPLQNESWLNVIERAFAPRGDDGHEISLCDGRRIGLATRSLAGEPGQLILLTDQTETRQLQDRVHHNERLTSMGKMMAALAHQLRTPLASATLYSSHLQKATLDAATQQRFAQKVSTQLHAIEQQIRDMLIFARSDIQLTQRVTLAHLLDRLEESMALSIEQANANYTLRCDAYDAEVFCHCEILVGALLNLVSNAVQAVEEGASISIEVITTDTTVKLCISDKGPGFGPEVKQALQQPFFSTKPQGTGLGLAVVRSVVEAHHGSFDIDSEPGKGTWANVELPRAKANEGT